MQPTQTLLSNRITKYLIQPYTISTITSLAKSATELARDFSSLAESASWFCSLSSLSNDESSYLGGCGEHSVLNLLCAKPGLLLRSRNFGWRQFRMSYFWGHGQLMESFAPLYPLSQFNQNWRREDRGGKAEWASCPECFAYWSCPPTDAPRSTVFHKAGLVVWKGSFRGDPWVGFKAKESRVCDLGRRAHPQGCLGRSSCGSSCNKEECLEQVSKEVLPDNNSRG